MRCPWLLVAVVEVQLMDYVSGWLLDSLLMTVGGRKDDVSRRKRTRRDFGGYIDHRIEVKGRMSKRDSERKVSHSLNTQPLACDKVAVR